MLINPSLKSTLNKVSERFYLGIVMIVSVLTLILTQAWL